MKNSGESSDWRTTMTYTMKMDIFRVFSFFLSIVRIVKKFEKILQYVS